MPHIFDEMWHRPHQEPQSVLSRLGGAVDCPATAAMVRAAYRGWAPARHWLHHAGVRSALHELLLVAERLRRRELGTTSAPALAAGSSSSRGGARRVSARKAGRAPQQQAAMQQLPPLLPPELWLVVAGFVLRSWWAAPLGRTIDNGPWSLQGYGAFFDPLLD